LVATTIGWEKGADILIGVNYNRTFQHIAFFDEETGNLSPGYSSLSDKVNYGPMRSKS
jgi:hypothetical protein